MMWIKSFSKQKDKAFILPSVIIASIVMLIVLSVSVSATVTVRTVLKEQYYAQLSQTAGEAGLEYAKSCLRSNSNKPLWTDAKPLKPNTDCGGNELVTCPTTSTDSACSVLLNGNIRTTFSVPLPSVDSAGYATYVRYSGFVELLRTSSKAVWRTYEQRGNWQVDFATYVPPVSDGLVLNLDAGNPSSYIGTGTTWTDLSGNNRNFTLVNSPTYSGANGGAFTFNGTTQYATIPFSTSPFRQTSAITYDFWMNRTGTSTSSVMGTTVSGGVGTGSIASGNGLIRFEYTPTTPNSDTTIQATFTSNVNLWAHYSFTFNFATGAYQWYLNGNPITTTISQSVTNFTPNTSYNVASGSDLIGGRNVNSAISYLGGSLSIVRLYNRALSASEVLQNFNSAKDRFD